MKLLLITLILSYLSFADTQKQEVRSKKAGS